MKHFQGEYSVSLNSNDLYDLDLPLRSNRAKGGTLVMWKSSLEPFITVHRTESSSFLPIIINIPHVLTSIHICVYLPTAGQDSEYLAELAGLKVVLDELFVQYPDSALFIRGDANSSKSNTKRWNILSSFIEQYEMKRVSLNHNTYHHFTGNGGSDSELDILLFSNKEGVNEELVDLLCRQENPLIDSHHDVLVSSCSIPSKPDPVDISENVVAPRIENNRHKIVWSQEGISKYEEITSLLLPGIRTRWLESSSETSMSVLLQATNFLMNQAAAEANKVVPLHISVAPKSANIPKPIRKSSNLLSMLNSRVKYLLSNPFTSEESLEEAKMRLKIQKNRHRRLVRWTRHRLNLARDTRLRPDCSDGGKMSQVIKQTTTKAPLAIHKLHVGNKVYEGKYVPDGFYDSISSLKSLDEQDLASSKSFASVSENYRYILKLCQSSRKVPPISENRAREILKSIRPCVNDYYSITAAHYIHSGQAGLDHFCFLLNSLIEDLNNLKVEELNMVWACVLHKGHGKDRSNHRSYRTISTCPFLSKALDSYVSSLYSPIWNEHTSPTQFQCKSSSHDLAALTLTETILHSTKVLSRPVFVLYLDARSAFDVALKEFIIDNLYDYGVQDQGLILIDKRLSNRKTVCEWSKVMMGPISDQCGVEQGGINSSDFYKVYNNEQLGLAQESDFGVQLGPVTVSALGQADDVALISDNLHALQGLLDLSLYYCEKYHVKLSSEKTKLQVFSLKTSKLEAFTAQATSQLNIYGQKISFVEEAEHVGVVRSVHGNHPHLLARFVAHRRSLFKILPAGIAWANRGNPAANLRAHSTYCIPVLLSGLGSLALSASEVNLLDQHMKVVIQRLQKLQHRTPHCVVMFLGGHLPGRALLHLKVFSVFGMITRLPGSFINLIAKSKLLTATPSSGSWFLQVRKLCILYGLPSPLSLLEFPLSKHSYKSLVKSKVVDYWETLLRGEAAKLQGSSLRYFKPQFMSLTKPHLLWRTCGSNPYEVHKAVTQARMLSGRYMTDKLSRHWTQNSLGLCSVPGCSGEDVGSLEHFLLECPALNIARSHAVALCNQVATESRELSEVLQLLLQGHSSNIIIVQFLLDCSTFPQVIRLTQIHGINFISRLFYVTRTWCYAIHRCRMTKLEMYQYR